MQYASGETYGYPAPRIVEFSYGLSAQHHGHEGHKETLLDEVKLILGTLFPEFDLASLTINPSRTGRFHSVRANVYLTEAEQVNSLYKMLDEAASIRTVL